MEYLNSRNGLAALVATGLAGRAFRRKQLTPAGCSIAWIVGFVATRENNLQLAVLATFFLSSTFVTKFGAKRKKKIDAEYHASGNRSAWQVLANGGISTGLLALHQAGVVPLSSRVVNLAVLAHYAACQGDTWSSEIGVLASQKPRLLVGLRQVPTGTNGGVSLAGFGGAAASGVLLGAIAAATNAVSPSEGISTLSLLGVSVVGAVGGSALDSLIGQYLQASYETPSGTIVDSKPSGEETSKYRHISGIQVLSNNAVNFVTAGLVTAATVFLSNSQRI